jgi:S-adenosylmethionine-diacylgycerolhomoserine-N-methlytransferase
VSGNEPASPAHAALMDQVYRRQRHIYDLSRKYFLFGRDRMVRELDARPGESIVEIGCGTARNLIQIAIAYPGTRLYGLDASEQMLITARAAAARLGGRISLRQGLAEKLDPAAFGEPEGFEHAIFSYSLSMIPDWRAALNAAASALRPGGHVHVVDFGDLKGLWPPAERALRAWLAHFHVAPRGELLQALEELSRLDPERCTLGLLPGRYAFVLKASPEALAGIAGAPPP